MRNLFLASLMLAMSATLVGADDKADVRKAVRGAVKDDIDDLIKGKKLPKLNAKQVQGLVDNFTGYYSDEVIDGILRTGDPTKAQIKNPKKGWFKSRVGFVAFEGNGGYYGLVNRVENVVSIDDTTEVVFKFQPVGVVALFIPWDKGAPDLDNTKVLRPVFNKDKKAWTIVSPGAGSIQLLK